MKRSLPIVLSLALCAATATHAADPRGLRETPAANDVAVVCETALPHMRDVLAAMKAGQPLRRSQEATWRLWNKQCRHASWQQALAEGLPPAMATPVDLAQVPERHPAPSPPPSVPSLTWRHYAVATLQGLERGLTAPMVYCRQTTLPRKGTAYTYSYCY